MKSPPDNSNGSSPNTTLLQLCHLIIIFVIVDKVMGFYLLINYLIIITMSQLAIILSLYSTTFFFLFLIKWLVKVKNFTVLQT